MAKRGLLISFEGPEGSGKTTHIPKVAEWLMSRGYDVMTLREPGGTAIGEKIRHILHDNNNVEMDDRTEALLYAAARAQIVHEVIMPALEDGKIVLLDRFRESTRAYQGEARGLGEIVDTLNNFATEGLESDIVMYLDVPVEVGLERRLKNNQEFNRLDAQSLAFHQKVRSAYLTIYAADEKGRWEKIDANRSMDEVLSSVVAALERRLGTFSMIEKPSSKEG
jgi:dTMP kinase